MIPALTLNSTARPMKPQIWALLTLSLLVLLGGCSRREVAVMDSRKIPTPKIEGDVEGLAIKRYHVEHDGDLLSVQVEMENQRASEVKFQYRYLWFDNQGRLFEMPNSRWLSKSVAGKDTVILPGVAPYNGISDYVLKIKLSP